MTTKSYSELCQMSTFEQRFEYLRLYGSVGVETYGFDRHLNQRFYRSAEWKEVRNHVIYRDEGCDLGIPGHEIHGALLIHHINPMTVDALKHSEDWILDPEFLITTMHNTHNAIHYSDASLLPKTVVARQPGDTRLW